MTLGGTFTDEVLKLVLTGKGGGGGQKKSVVIWISYFKPILYDSLYNIKAYWLITVMKLHPFAKRRECKIYFVIKINIIKLYYSIKFIS